MIVKHNTFPGQTDRQTNFRGALILDTWVGPRDTPPPYGNAQNCFTCDQFQSKRWAWNTAISQSYANHISRKSTGCIKNRFLQPQPWFWVDLHFEFFWIFFDWFVFLIYWKIKIKCKSLTIYTCVLISLDNIFFLLLVNSSIVTYQ